VIVRLVTIDRLRQIALSVRMAVAVDTRRNVAYLRVAQTKYEAPLGDAA